MLIGLDDFRSFSGPSQDRVRTSFFGESVRGRRDSYPSTGWVVVGSSSLSPPRRRCVPSGSLVSNVDGRLGRLGEDFGPRPPQTMSMVWVVFPAEFVSPRSDVGKSILVELQDPFSTSPDVLLHREGIRF